MLLCYRYLSSFSLVLDGVGSWDMLVMVFGSDVVSV